MKTKILTLAMLSLTLVSCDDFLTREPLDTVTDVPSFWNDETNIRTEVLNLYTTYFPGYRSGWSRADNFAETNVADWTDDNAQAKATFFTKVAPTTATAATAWSFSDVRSINLLIQRVSTSTLAEEAKNHWLGVARFLRAMEYATLVSRFGDVPYYDETLGTADYEKLYKPRESRATVMDKVLDDLQFATKNIRVTDGTAGLYITRDVANAFASRIMLFEGTWQKYREKKADLAKKYLKESMTFAKNIMDGGKYRLCDTYKDLTTSEDLAGNPEIIMYRSYVDGVVTHSLMAFQNTEKEESSPSRSFVDAFLSTNGLPIRQADNALFKGDTWFFDEITDRDPRLLANVDVTGLQLVGVASVSAVSGYFANRYVNESLKDKAGGRSSTCITDAPVMKYNEVLMNYIEAAAELADLKVYSLMQADFDKTINVIRDRKSTSMPHVTLSGDKIAVKGVTINDPERDQDVSPVLWEVRRERRTELAYEGLRFNDLRRWGKLQYADMKLNAKLNKGAWLDKARYVAWYNEVNKKAIAAGTMKAITLDNLKSLTLDRSGDAGYIVPITKEDLLRVYAEKDYLYPLPQDQITLYKSRGYELKQNPGW